MSTTKTIVVTGMGATTPIGGTARESWDALLAGASGARPIDKDWVADLELPVTFAAQAAVDPAEVLARPEAKRLDPASQHGLIAAREAWLDAGFALPEEGVEPSVDPDRLGVDFSTGIGGLWTLLDAWDTLRERGPRRVLPMTIPMLMPNAAASAISMSLVARAYARTVVSACASSTEAIVNAYEHLQHGLAHGALSVLFFHPRRKCCLIEESEGIIQLFDELGGGRGPELPGHDRVELVDQFLVTKICRRYA